MVRLTNSCAPFNVLNSMKRKILAILLLFITAFSYAQEEAVTLSTPTGDINGMLLLPDSGTPCPIVLIIAGSGPTDMDGNTIGTDYRNNSLRQLAEALAKNGIATLRYDKRGIGKSSLAGSKEEDLRFEHYIDDAAGWTELLGKDKRFNRIVVAGHSEGSLIGMVASNKSPHVNAYISIAGCGSPAYEIIEEQLSQQPEQIQREAATINKELKEGRTVENVPTYFAALYRKSVQPYLISWFCYSPSKEIAKLKIPTLILQGDRDIQVGVKEAEKLRMGRLFSSYHIIENMNHVLKECKSNDIVLQLQTYKDPEIPVKQELIEYIVSFVKQ